MYVTIEVDGEVQASRRIMRFAERIDDWSGFFSGTMVPYFQSVERSQFDSQGRTGSGGWAPLKARTIAAKKARGLDSRILRATERLRKSLMNKTAEGNVIRIERDSMFFGTNVPYAVFHQRGAPRANLPQRKVIDLTENNRRKIVKKAQAYLHDRGVSEL